MSDTDKIILVLSGVSFIIFITIVFLIIYTIHEAIYEAKNEIIEEIRKSKETK